MERNLIRPLLHSLLVIFLAFSIFMLYATVVQAGTTSPQAWIWQVDDPPGPQTVIVAEQPDDEFGEVLASGDVNGDGFEDLIVGARSVGDLGFIAGEVYVLPGPFAFGEAYTMPQRAALRLFGSMAGVELGAYVNSGDMNGDGYDDIVIGALGEANTYLFLGSPEITTTSPIASVMTPNSVAMTIFGPDDGILEIVIADMGFGDRYGKIYLIDYPLLSKIYFPLFIE